MCVAIMSLSFLHLVDILYVNNLQVAERKLFLSLLTRTVICFVSTSAKFGPCTVVSVNATLVEDTMCKFKGECTQISDGASAKFGTNLHETDNSAFC
jgi:hypothetical protein